MLAKLHEVVVPLAPMTWREALRAGAPDTSPDYDAWNIGTLIPPMDTSVRIVKVTLVAFEDAQQTHAVQGWGLSRGLTQAHPAVALAVGASNPLLIDEMDRRSLGIATLLPFHFRGSEFVCTLWWYPRRRVGDKEMDPERIAFLTRHDLEGTWSRDYCFAFVA